MAYFHSPQIVKDGLVLLLDAGNPKSYPGSGTTWQNLLRNSYNFTLSNTPTFNTSFPSSLTFDGTNQFATGIGTGAFFIDPTTEALTISTWLNIPSAATWSNTYKGTIIAKGGFGGSVGLVRDTVDNRVQFWIRGGTSGNGGAVANISRDAWYHLTGTWSSSQSKIYVNGVLQDTVTLAIVGNMDATAFYIAFALAFSGATGNYMNGSVAYTQFYDKALDSTEVLQNYNATKGRFGL